ncbi:MAG: sensor histidine kinase [Actinobacteria bacterium]|nr:sensor histidine kinase [Actinomycetota bacterium]MCG2800572.1 histidine kinase [Cellulomonas sp.]
MTPLVTSVRDAQDAPTRGDAAVAAASWLVALAVLSSLDAVAGLDPGVAVHLPRPGGAGWWLGLAVVTAQAVALLWRRRHPGTVLVLVAAGVPVGAAVGLGDGLGITSVALLVAAFTVAVTGRLRRDAGGLAAAVVLVGAGTLLGRPGDGPVTALTLGGALLQAVATVALALPVGSVVRARREAAQAHRREVEALAREQGARIEAALARERAAMARELHDIAAHHLSGIAMMTGAIVGQIDADPEAAKASVRRVRSETTAMLGELRSLVHLLRDAGPAHDPDGGSTGVETLASVPALVERARAAGLDATLSVLGANPPPGPGADAGPLAQLAAFRTVQESLANAVRHAPGAHCEVVLDARDRTTLLVSVRNGPPPAGRAPDRDAGAPDPGRGGLGLVGMRERADLTGARLEVGPQPDGGWLVTLAVPRHPDASPAAPDLDPDPPTPTPGAPA